MNPREVEQMIGGYATGSLTPAERDALFRAALEDQQLFDALADEDALRELLADPAVRQRLLGHLAPKPSAWQRFVAWIGQPIPMAATATAAIGFVAAALLLQTRETKLASPPPVQVAETRPAPAIQMEERARTQAPMPTTPAAKPAPQQKAMKADSVSAPKQEAPASAVLSEPPPELRAEAAAAPVPALPATAPAAPAEPAKAKLVRAAGAVSSEAPFRYQIERLQRDGTWVQFGGEVDRNDRVRLRVTAALPGTITLSEGPRILQSQRVEPGSAYTFEIASNGQRNERAFDLGYSRSQVAPAGAVAGFRSARQPAMAGTDAEKKVSNSVESAPYSVTVRLRFE
ncbi:MAG: hypothetical protein U0Q16_00245 [Bryobacteraceae bacterium]